MYFIRLNRTTVSFLAVIFITFINSIDFINSINFINFINTITFNCQPARSVSCNRPLAAPPVGLPLRSKTTICSST